MKNAAARIVAAYKSMALNGHEEEITVMTLVKACGISRQTFYYYFSDLEDIRQTVYDQGLKAGAQKYLEAKNPAEAVYIYVEDLLHRRFCAAIAAMARLTIP